MAADPGPADADDPPREPGPPARSPESGPGSQGSGPPAPGRLSQAADVPWTWLDALAVLALTLVLVGLIGQRLVGAGAALSGPAIPVTAVVLAAVTLGYVGWRHRGAAGRLFGVRRPGAADLGVAAGLALLALFGNAAIVSLLTALVQERGGDLPAIQQSFRDAALDAAAFPWLAATAVVLAPIAEELFFRGMLFQALRRHMDVWPAAGIAGLAFTGVHAQSTLLGTGLVFLVIFPLGLLLAWVFDRRGTLAVPVGIHALFNLAGLVALRLGAPA